MLSLTNPFRHATYINHNAVPLAPPLAPLAATTTTSASTRPPWQTDQKLSSLLSACEAGTHAFSHDDYADGTRRPSTGESPHLVLVKHVILMRVQVRNMDCPNLRGRRRLMGICRWYRRQRRRGRGKWSRVGGRWVGNVDTLIRVGIRGCCICSEEWM